MPNSFKRLLKLNLPPGQSAFLWGPRQSGKSRYLRSTFDQSEYFDLLDFDLVNRFSTRPRELGELLATRTPAVRSRPIIIDEVQNVPALLNEVHRLIESEGLSFVLCGSSTRKLKRPGVNLLGGRAWRFNMHPLSMTEIPDFNLLRAINHGLLPRFYIAQNTRNLDAYLLDYLESEIYNEAYVRNVAAFSRFFQALQYCHGEILNYSSVSRDCGVSNHTVKSYFEILEDTLVGHLIYPYSRATGRQTIVASPKFYLFDVGVAGRLCNRNVLNTSGSEFGKAFEHFILMEIMFARDLRERNYLIKYWRTKSGLEVDFVLGDGEIAIEVKSRVRQGDLKSISAFVKDHKPKRAIVVTAENDTRKVGDIEILPYQDFVIAMQSGSVL